jgi:hypothetical protein
METETLFIVGNSFANFAEKNLMVSTLDEFKLIIKSPPICNYYLRIGQGVSNKDLKDFIEVINDSEYRKYYELDDAYLNFQSDAEHRKSVHKHKLSNVMISPPANLGSNCFISSVCLQNECAELSDHSTGQHVQGMVLIEAARQMVLSVSENYLLNDEQKYKSAFVIKNMNINFKNFMFPVNADARLIASNISQKKFGGIDADTITTFFQNGIEVANVSLQLSTYDNEFINGKEEKMAILVCEQLIENKGKERECMYG